MTADIVRIVTAGGEEIVGVIDERIESSELVKVDTEFGQVIISLVGVFIEPLQVFKKRMDLKFEVMSKVRDDIRLKINEKYGPNTV